MAEQLTLKYDYELQTWLRLRADADGIPRWTVEPCGHPDSMKPHCCYAGTHASETIVRHPEIH